MPALQPHRPFLFAALLIGLAGCKGGGGGSVEPPPPEYNPLTAFFVESFAPFETAAAILRTQNLRYLLQKNSWYFDTNQNGQRDDPAEPLYQSYPLAAARVEYAHAAGLTGEGVLIAVVDDGFLPSHEAFDGKSIIESGSLQARDHGTMVASVAAGDSESMVGVAPKADLLLGQFNSNSALTAATDLALLSGAVVQNNSWGFVLDASANSFSTLNHPAAYRSYFDALKAYAQTGVVVFAVSNDEDATTAMIMDALPLHLPELESGWLAVINAVPSFDNNTIVSAIRISSPCNEAAPWCLAADGTWIAASSSAIDSYSFATGSSFAAPMVSGALALLAQAFPEMPAHDLRLRLLASADNSFAGFSADDSLELVPGFFHDYSYEWGHGFLDLRAALLPIGVVTAAMADGMPHTMGTPYLIAGGAIGDALARSLAAHDILITDTFGGDFKTAGDALVAQSQPRPLSASYRPLLASEPLHFAGGDVLNAFQGQTRALQAGAQALSFAVLLPSAASQPAEYGIALARSFETEAGQLHLGFTLAQDRGSLIGLGGTAQGGGTNTLATLDLGLTSELGETGFLHIAGQFGLVLPGANQPVAALTAMQLNSFGLDLGRKGVWRGGDRLALGVSLPTALASGSGQISLPVTRSLGAVQYDTTQLRLAPQNRQINLSLSYATPLGEMTDLTLGAIHASNHGHIAGKSDFAVTLGWQRKF